MLVKIEKVTENFAVFDYRDNPYDHNRGIDIISGEGDGLYSMDLAELEALKVLIEEIIALMSKEQNNRKPFKQGCF